MTVKSLLTEFYKENELPENGGVNNDKFEIRMFGINLKLPNPKFRKDIIHIHDIEHILNKCDVSWKGEAFIGGWELSTGFWKHFPVCLISIFSTGYSFWLHPKAVYKGFKKGLNNIGIIDLKISKADLMKMEHEELLKITKREKHIEMGFLQWIQFVLWILICQVSFLFPFLAIGLIWILTR